MKISLEGANCGDLPAFVVDKYFNCRAGTEPFKAQVAKAICSNCVVLEDCRIEALSSKGLPDRGVIAGVTVSSIRIARRWRRYEQGMTDRVPKEPRPEWLSMTEATHQVEQYRLETDPDEPFDDDSQHTGPARDPPHEPST